LEIEAVGVWQFCYESGTSVPDFINQNSHHSVLLIIIDNFGGFLVTYKALLTDTYFSDGIVGNFCKQVTQKR
jgi:hypothetical protein